MRFQGTFTAMITPFLPSGALDEKGFIQNLHRQLEAKVEGVVFVAATGESATVTSEEVKKMTQIAVKEAKGKMLIGVGTGSNATLSAVEKTQKAKDLGADFALVVAPYYNRPSQEGIVRHFEAVARVGLPVLIYNNPGRVGVNVEPATLERIADFPSICGIKESTDRMSQAAEMIYTLHRKRPNFVLWSGDDILTLPLIALGATGLLSIVGNLVPEKMSALVNAALQGRFAEARRIHEELLPLFKASVMEVNPMPIKEAMHLCHLPAGPCRLPLCGMRPENRAQLQSLLQKMGLLLMPSECTL
jgi:4-hydroxy-tetrahydrodipicolinate synthase